MNEAEIPLALKSTLSLVDNRLLSCTKSETERKEGLNYVTLRSFKGLQG